MDMCRGRYSRSLGSKGVSPLIASVLSILLGIMMLAVVLTVIQPTFKTAQDSSTIADIFQNLNLIDAAIKEVSSEAEGSKRTIPITVTAGEYRINETYDWIYVTYEPESDMRLSGRRGDIRVDRGLVYAEYFNWFPEGTSGEPEGTNMSGHWSMTSMKYVGSNGTSYMNITPRPIESFEFSGAITNVSGMSGGQIFVLPVPLENLMAYWAFGNGSGVYAFDYSGLKNNGTLVFMNTVGNSTSGWQNASGCASGSNCLRFDGVNDHVYVANDQSLDLTDEFTIGGWFFMNDNNLDARPLYKEVDWMWEIDQTTGRLKFNVFDGAWATYNSGYTPPVGQWVHIVVTYDSTTANKVRFYVNGNLYSSVDTTTNYISTGGNVLIGVAVNTSASQHFNGMIDEVMIFNRTLDADQVKALHETSVKKLYSTGSHSISSKIWGSLVLANPAGQTQFDNIKIVRGDLNRLSFLIPYSRADLNGTMALEKGEYLVEIAHRGTNSTLNKPIIEITAS